MDYTIEKEDHSYYQTWTVKFEDGFICYMEGSAPRLYDPEAPEAAEIEALDLDTFNHMNFFDRESYEALKDCTMIWRVHARTPDTGDRNIYLGSFSTTEENTDLDVEIDALERMDDFRFQLEVYPGFLDEFYPEDDDEEAGESCEGEGADDECVCAGASCAGESAEDECSCADSDDDWPCDCPEEWVDMGTEVKWLMEASGCSEEDAEDVVHAEMLFISNRGQTIMHILGRCGVDATPGGFNLIKYMYAVTMEESDCVAERFTDDGKEIFDPTYAAVYVACHTRFTLEEAERFVEAQFSHLWDFE